MNIVVDTHTLFWFLTADKRLSTLAKETLEKAQKVFIPTVVLLELFYLVNKKASAEIFRKLHDKLKTNPKFIFVSLDMVIAEKVIETNLRIEMHDLVIIASSQILKAPLITRDETIQKVYKKIIW
ncbi:PIN domain-containing protein [Candidatus Daviesbacteria bacterium]|nr:PIN domain-containing protein [Candidatus Daviesbacteria bacterium]